jgi:hypothetical protein
MRPAVMLRLVTGLARLCRSALSAQEAPPACRSMDQADGVPPRLCTRPTGDL